MVNPSYQPQYRRSSLRNQGFVHQQPVYVQPRHRIPQAYPPMENSYPPPNQNPAFLNQAFMSVPPPYSPAGNQNGPVYLQSGGNMYGKNYVHAPPAPPIAPPPLYDVIMTGQPFDK